MQIKHHTKKKSTTYREACPIKQEEFKQEIVDKAVDQLVFLDQSGIDGYIYREYAWQDKGKRAQAKISGKRFARESFMAAICEDKVLAPICYSGTCDSKLFNIWVEDFLIPELKPGQIIILDNASFHKSTKTKELIEAAGCRLLFLPPYSPELNPIETFWANLKEKVRSIIHQFKSLQDAIDFAFN